MVLSGVVVVGMTKKPKYTPKCRQFLIVRVRTFSTCRPFDRQRRKTPVWRPLNVSDFRLAEYMAKKKKKRFPGKGEQCRPPPGSGMMANRPKLRFRISENIIQHHIGVRILVRGRGKGKKKTSRGLR